MGTGTAGEASRAGTRAIRRDRLVQRTIELTEPEIAAVEAGLRDLAATFGDRLYVELQRHMQDNGQMMPAEVASEAGMIQLAYALGLPLVEQPDLAARPDVAARVAAAYWTSAGLNALADAGNFREITRKINGGYNGWDDRV